MASTVVPTVPQLDELRRMVAEPTHTTYDDNALRRYLNKYALFDVDDNEPGSADWDVTSCDLHAAAADIWEEKAALVAHQFDYSADGGRYDASKKYEQYMKNARHHRSRRAPGTHTMLAWPVEPAQPVWIGNLAEPDN